jgi:hypothetical protein
MKWSQSHSTRLTGLFVAGHHLGQKLRPWLWGEDLRSRKAADRFRPLTYLFYNYMNRNQLGSLFDPPGEAAEGVVRPGQRNKAGRMELF